MTERHADESTENVARDSGAAEREGQHAETELKEPEDTDESTERVATASGPEEREGEQVETEERGEEAPSGLEPLLAPQEGNDFRNRWEAIQTGFVDEPRQAVEQADMLVESLMKRLADGFSERRSQLEEHWDRGDEVSTEDLRIALKRYRSFFDRLLRA